MKQVIEQLSSIQQVEVPEHLFDRIMAKKEAINRDVIPMHWVKLAAASILLFFAMEFFYFANKNEQVTSASTFGLTVSNELYHE